MLRFYHSSTLTKNTHNPVRQNGTAAFVHTLSNEGAHTLTHTKLHTASFISGALFISGSVATPQGIYSEEYISSEECRIGKVNILLD